MATWDPMAVDGASSSVAASLADARALAAGGRAAVLVEGVSDERALEALARRGGRDLGGEGVAVVPMGGSKSVGHFLRALGPDGLGLELAGLCDAGEESDFRRGLELIGFGVDLSRSDMERLGFFVCVDDLEDELIRSLGASAVEQVVAAQGEIEALRRFRRQPAQRDRPVEAQLRRFLGTRSGRKIRYAELLVEALDPQRVPAPLAGVLASV